MFYDRRQEEGVILHRQGDWQNDAGMHKIGVIDLYPTRVVSESQTG